jgi:hypothetical protein
MEGKGSYTENKKQRERGKKDNERHEQSLKET